MLAEAWARLAFSRKAATTKDTKAQQGREAGITGGRSFVDLRVLRG
jgi:hypothetical protein